MKNRDLMIAIPTVNHTKLIMYYLAKNLDVAKERNIDICIFDASLNDETEKIVKNRIMQGYDNLFYKKYAANTLLEDRCQDIYVGVDYKYVWLCGDGCVLNLNKCIDILEEEIKKNKDLICFGKDTIFVDGYKEYTDSALFCKECFAATTLFGGVVIKTNLITKELFEYCKERYKEHAVPAIYYEVFSDGKINASYIRQNFYEFSIYKKNSVAVKEGRNIYAFAQLFTQTIWKIPLIYEPIKKDIEKSLGKTTKMYEWNCLWLMRVDGNLNLNIYRKNRKYLKIAADTSLLTYILIALCPLKIAKRIAAFEGHSVYKL